MPTSNAEPHRHRQVAESFGADPDRYDRSRPRYPDAIVKRLAAATRASETRDSETTAHDVVDVGCGTGIVARQLRAAGCQVLGVEPDARMAEFARRRGLPVEVATFEDWDPAGREFGAVVAGQAWHWVDPVAGAGKAARALRPGGHLSVFWNEARPPADLAAATAAVYRWLLPESLVARWAAAADHSYEPLCVTTVDGVRATASFLEPQRWSHRWQRVYTRDEWLDLVPTQGGHHLFPPSDLEALLAGLGAAVDAVGGSFVMDYVTTGVTAVRAGLT